jgi:hypothetical protein
MPLAGISICVFAAQQQQLPAQRTADTLTVTSFDVPVFKGGATTMLLKRFSALVVAMHRSAVRPLLSVSLLPSVALHLTPATTSCSRWQQQQQ